MKQRISGLDLQILGKELKESIESYRLTNIYNVVDSSKQFLLKFGKPDSKLNVIVDCGSRIHLTTFNRPTPPMPSGFVSKLRKHLKGKRLTAFRQVPNDRIVVMQFADGLYYLVFEFFSAGNVILLDEDRNILSLQRIVFEHENKVNEVYKMFDETIFLDEHLIDNTKREEYTTEMVKAWFAPIVTNNDIDVKDKKKKIASIHKLLLRNQPHLSSDLLSNNLKKASITPNSSCLEYIGKEDIIVKLLMETQDEYMELLKMEEKCGYIVANKNANYDATKDEPELEFIYENFHPFKPFIKKSEEDQLHLFKIEGRYNKTVDTFFSTVESNRFAIRIQNQESQARKRLDDARLDNNKKLQALTDVQSSNETKAQIIINNASLVEEAKYAVQNLLDQQTDWNTIEKLIQNEKKKGNPIAKLIQTPLLLKRNKININLPINALEENESEDNISDGGENPSDVSDSSDDSDSDNSDSDNSDNEVIDPKKKKNSKKNSGINDKSKYVTVAIDLSLSAYANASQYFDVKKSSAQKQKRVEKNIEKAMKNIETKIDQQLKKKLKETHEVLKKIRTPYFFEKFNWFISNEGFLILMGKSPIETDQIYSKYIEEDDVYVSNSFNSHVWIKNPEKTEIPPNTLMQAGILCMSASEAWSKKFSSAAWYCFSKNISKFDDHSSDVLPPGQFRIKKDSEVTHLSASQLVMGIAFLWKVKNDKQYSDDECEVNEEEADDEEKEELNSNNRNGDLAIPVQEEAVNNFGIEDISKDIKELEFSDNGVNEEIQEDLEDDSVSIATNIIEQMNKNVRGKKGKLRKIQKKYADQDDAERLLSLKALGTLKGIEKDQNKKIDELVKQQDREYKKMRREKQKQQQALKFTQNEKIKISYERFKDELKPTVSADDEVIDIVPVFAPWPTLQKYKYKVKIQPGSAKKTKSMSEVLHYFLNRKVDTSCTDKEMDWPEEHKFIKAVKEPELVPLLCVDKLNISLPGSKSSNGNKTSKNKGGKKSKK